MKIGFIGTGIMGAPMAKHLLDAGYPLNVYTRTKDKAAELIKKGAHWYDSPAELAKDSDVIITMVGYPKDVEEVYFGEDGLIENARPGTYLIDMTTTDPELSEAIKSEGDLRDLHVLDAPVTGGDVGAKNATLTILVGGDVDDYEMMLPIFNVLGKTIRHMGGAGAGQQTKMANQIAIAGALAGACEAMAYAKEQGLDPTVVQEAISGGAASSVQLNGVVRRALDGDLNPGFLVRHFLKDIHIAKRQSGKQDLDLPVLEEVIRMTEDLEKEGKGDLGTQALVLEYGFEEE